MSDAAPDLSASRGSPRWALLVVIIGAVAVRLWSWSWAMQMTNDGIDFLWQAQRLLAGEFELMLRHPYHPLTGALIAALSWLPGGVMTGAVAVSALSGALIVLAAHDIARMAFPHLRHAGLWAAVLAAVHSRTIIYTSDVQSDGLFLALFLFAIRMAFASVERGVCRRRMAAAGLLTGLAYLTRPEGLFVALPLGLWALSAWRRAEPSRARVVSGVATFALVLVVVALPYVMTVRHYTGTWGISMKPSLSAVGLSQGEKTNRPPDEAPISSPKVRRATVVPTEASPPPVAEPKQGSLLPLPWVQADTRRLQDSALRQSLDTFVNTLREDTLVMALIGLFALWRWRRGTAVLLLLVCGAWIALSTYHLMQSTYLSARHIMAPMVLMLPLGGAGIAVAWSAAREQPWLRWGLRVLVLLSLLAMLASGVRPRHEDHGPRLDALAWVAAQTEADERIGVHRRKDGWYAQRRVLVVTTPCDENDLLKKMERYGVRYLVFDAHRIARHMPHWLEGGPMRQVKDFSLSDGVGKVIVFERADVGG
jgi:4-amino-4-deoxy-L-arabinose transferase-like glycosyltransferase